MNKEIVITITEVRETNVSYSGSLFSGCHISNFPDKPSAGDKYILTYNTKNPAKIISIVKS